MRKIFTLFFLSLSVIAFSQDNRSITIDKALAGRMGCGLVNSNLKRIADTVVITGNCWPKANVASNGKDTLQTGIRMRCTAIIFPIDPLIVIDGVPVENKSLASLDPNTVESIDILKSPTAEAIYGYMAAAGVIIITTKSANSKTFRIKDFLNGNPIPAATVQFDNIKTGQSYAYTTNDSGVVIFDKPGAISNYHISVSSVGFQPLMKQQIIKYKKGGVELLMTRDEKICEEVIVRSNQIICLKRVIFCGFWCLSSGILITGMDSTKTVQLIPQMSITAYPNPAQRNTEISLKIENASQKIEAIRVLTVSGSTVYKQAVARFEKKGTLQLVTGNWPAGIYFIQLLYANGKPAASERIVIK